ncbi:hypothetical protein K523DRAFT_335220 [Schizophyllum commune Tattone D]|nr:hypothetical protein K523DRAFT_335220 [Schizophyllum commune Tattone D]
MKGGPILSGKTSRRPGTYRDGGNVICSRTDSTWPRSSSQWYGIRLGVIHALLSRTAGPPHHQRLTSSSDYPTSMLRKSAVDFLNPPVNTDTGWLNAQHRLFPTSRTTVNFEAGTITNATHLHPNSNAIVKVSLRRDSYITTAWARLARSPALAMVLTARSPSLLLPGLGSSEALPVLPSNFDTTTKTEWTRREAGKKMDPGPWGSDATQYLPQRRSQCAAPLSPQ